MLMYGLTFSLYRKDQGDLVRLGFLFSDPAPQSEVAAQYPPPPMRVEYLSKQDLGKGGSWDVITFGDSFGDQDANGFQNYMSQQGLRTLHVDRAFTQESPLQNLVGMLNAGFFDKFDTKYVVLESVERMTMIRSESLDLSNIKSPQETEKIWQNLQPKKGGTSEISAEASTHAQEPVKFFTDATIKAPLQNLQYLFFERPLKTDTWKIPTKTNQLFLNKPNHVLIFKDDIRTLKEKNNPQKVRQVNNAFNAISKLLAAKGIKLIVLVPPDKYDVYFYQMKSWEKRTQSQFWKILHALPKNYTFIPMDRILQEKIKHHIPNVYYYDDTHWSPVGARAAGEAIAAEIK